MTVERHLVQLLAKLCRIRWLFSSFSLVNQRLMLRDADIDVVDAVVVGDVTTDQHNHHDLVCLQCESLEKKIDLKPAKRVTFLQLSIHIPSKKKY